MHFIYMGVVLIVLVVPLQTSPMPSSLLKEALCVHWLLVLDIFCDGGARSGLQ